MPRQIAVAVENNFTKGLITEATGLKFPENACIDTYNCIFDRSGVVKRRKGITCEDHFANQIINRAGGAITTYYWKNVIGDDAVDIIVVQISNTLYFYSSSSATINNPLSNTMLLSNIVLTTGTSSLECQFTDGNGYLFVTRSDLDPQYITYAAGVLTATPITVKIRDFQGITETSVDDNLRPLTLTDNHRYNLANQGWNKTWQGTSTTSVTIGVGSKGPITTQAGLPIFAGDRIRVYVPGAHSSTYMVGIVTVYSGTSLTFTAATFAGAGTVASWIILPEPSYLNTWFDGIANYPSNSDVWWYFKDSTGDFDPATMAGNVSLSAGPSARGFYIIEAFNQQRDTVSGISGLTDVTTSGKRPSVITWFQGRVWYAGVKYQGFNESIYFSQIIENTTQFGKCYSVNDPTSEDRADLLPSDGGVIKIQGAGTIHRLFPIQNGLLVFSDKGIWFITGSQGIGFAANDFTVAKLSSIQTLAQTSFVNVKGYPMWWNEEGIYTVAPSEQGQLNVQSLTDATIASFYQAIPLTCKLWARGSFDPLNNIVQWVYKSTEPTDVTTRYEFDRILNFNTQVGCFYPWSIGAGATLGGPFVHDVMYLEALGGTNTQAAAFKYFSSTYTGGANYNFTFSEEWATSLLDWEDIVTGGTAMVSYLITGYKIRGDAIRKFQSNWIRLFCDNTDPSTFDIYSRWDYAITDAEGRWSNLQRVTMDDATNYSNRTRRLRLRGHGLVLQFKVSSVAGEPFDIIGWVTQDSGNAGL